MVCDHQLYICHDASPWTCHQRHRGVETLEAWVTSGSQVRFGCKADMIYCSKHTNSKWDALNRFFGACTCWIPSTFVLIECCERI